MQVAPKNVPARQGSSGGSVTICFCEQFKFCSNQNVCVIKIVDVITICNYNVLMKFEWDEKKNKENIKKHGIDFIDAPLIFNAPLLSKLDTKKNYGEERWQGIGLMKNFIVVLSWTERNNGNTIRMISIRRALKHERKAYEKNIKN